MHASARTALLYASAGHALCHGSKVVLAVGLLAAAQEFGVERDGLALALSAYGIGLGLCAVPGGLLADRLGPTRVLQIYLWSLAAASLLCWWAPTLAAFTVAHAALGAAAGLYHPPGLSLLSLSATPEERGPVMGWHGVLGQLGLVAAPVVTAARWGWRGGYLGLAAAAVAAALAGHLLASRGKLLRGLPEGGALPPERRSDRRSLVLLLAVMSLNGFLLDGFLSLFPSTVEERGIRPLERAALGPDAVNALILALSMLGPWLGGMLARASGPRRYALLVVGLPASLALSALTLDRPALAFLSFTSFVVLAYLLQPLENHLLAAYTSRTRRGAAYALKFSVAWVLGAAAPPLVLNLVESDWAATRGGDAVGYAALAGVAGAAAACGWIFVRRGSIPAVETT